jgi:hypothetical protein
MSTSTVSNIGNISGAVGTAAGVSGQLIGGFRTRGEARGLLDASIEEAAARLTAGEAVKEDALRNAMFALTDAANEASDSTLRQDAIQREGQRVVGAITARAAGAGVRVEGSPLLVALEAAVETDRQTNFEAIRSRDVQRRFTFEAERELRRAQVAPIAARTEATALLRRTGREAASLRARGTEQIFGAMRYTTEYLQSPSFRSLLSPSRRERTEILLP